MTPDALAGNPGAGDHNIKDGTGHSPKTDHAFTSSSISGALREARLRKGLELRDVSELTHVRLEYLSALEEGRFEDLPEPVYARNFLKLFANTVGLNGAALAERFSDQVGQPSPSPFKTEVDARVRSFPEDRKPALLTWLPMILLVAGVLAVSLWLFNSFLFRPSTNTRSVPNPDEVPTAESVSGAVEAGVVPPTQDEAAALAEAPEAAVPAVTEAETINEAGVVPGDILLTLNTTPPGAEVSIDNYVLPGRTPIENAPVSAGAGRVLRITLEGYAPLLETVDLSQDSSLSFSLQSEAELAAAELAAAEAAANGTALPESGAEAPSPTNAAESEPAATAGDGQLTLNVTEATWLEVYQGTARGQGQRLVYQTVQPGQSYSLELPVYVHVGNGSGVSLNLEGQDIGTLGSNGEVLGRAFE